MPANEPTAKYSGISQATTIENLTLPEQKRLHHGKWQTSTNQFPDLDFQFVPAHDSQPRKMKPREFKLFAGLSEVRGGTATIYRATMCRGTTAHAPIQGSLQTHVSILVLQQVGRAAYDS